MLIKRTPWIYASTATFGSFINKADTIAVCPTGLYANFSFKVEPRRIRFLVYDRYVKGAIKVYLHNYYVFTEDGKSCVDVIGFMSQDVFDRLQKKQKYYYVVCEYEE